MSWHFKLSMVYKNKTQYEIVFNDESQEISVNAFAKIAQDATYVGEATRQMGIIQDATLKLMDAFRPQEKK